MTAGGVADGTAAVATAVVDEFLTPHKQEDAMVTTSPLVGLVSGCAGAVALVYVGQPLDTVKVRMQLSSATRAVTSGGGGGGVSMWGCVRDMWRQALVTPVPHHRPLTNNAAAAGAVVEACPLTAAAATGQPASKAVAAGRMARLMYAGTVPALLANVAENGVLFAAYGPCQRLVSFALDLFGGSGAGTGAVVDVEKKLGPAGMATAGSLASLCSAFALCPTELIKVRLQAADLDRANGASASGTSVGRPHSAAAGTLQVVARVWTTEGGLRGMYRGLGSTVAREMPGYYVFFLAYEACRTYLTNWHYGPLGSLMTAKAPSVEHREDPAWVTMTAGAAAGTCLWLVVYPVDAIKSRIQASGGGGSTAESPSGGFLRAMALSVQNEGPLALYRGLAPTLLRTVPASAIMFWTVERTKTLLTGYGL
ncbi:mitochondrial ornithine transporter 1-like [Rhopalosiphum maidis]|uniref:mitochondrial ornithine transporter 1-like n=1 Tax=Rhopalosiphum maidis TaxID=43146 RepID=UPI000EFE0149|nr:mitochondrial ornithine transporter 1-like [Rhopalosiphum maidis]